jgi:excisionase family DNA binding protein
MNVTGRYYKEKPMITEPLLNVNQVAKLLSMHPSTIRKLIYDHSLKAIQAGTGRRGYRVERQAVQDYLDSKKVLPTEVQE